MSQLTSQVLEICRDHWVDVRHRCQGCPLIEPCSEHVTPMTAENMAARVTRMNEAAERSSQP
jgi:hypothetical protein